MTRRQERALKSCHKVRVEIGAPRYTDEKFDLYIGHKKKFCALQDDVEDEKNFRLSFYVNTSFGIEFEYYIDENLIGIALGDHTSNTFSAIYTFYDTDYSKLSLGTFSILKQLEFCRQRGIKFFYLGYYIGDNRSLKYKGDFRPNEIYVDHSWRPFRNAKGEYLVPEHNVLWRNTDFLVQAKVDQFGEKVERSKLKENLFF
jgi:arginine-tRNA-protein transferase